MASVSSASCSGDGPCRRFDHVVSAVSWKQLGKLLGPELLKQIPLAEAGTGLNSSPITAVHLWFDRPIMDLPHAALVGRLSQWVFQNSTVCSPPRRQRTAQGLSCYVHYTVVISASHALVGRDSKEVLQEVLGDLQAIWPTAGEAKLVHHRVLTQPGAVFSLRPGARRSGRLSRRRSTVSILPAIGPPPVGRPRWKAPCGAVTWRSRPSWPRSGGRNRFWRRI